MKTLLGLLVSASVLVASTVQLHVPVDKYKLDNGLRVILSQDNTTPVVAVYVLYNVGARSEEKGRTGFAHLFEHMMFEGSAHIKKGEHMQYVQANGGTMNGSTHPDYTDYFETLPSNKLALGLWLESDRMRSLNITPENLANQKEAVKQERRLRMDNRPYATAITEKWPQLAFTNWQSSHSMIGSFEDLNAATIDDVKQFFATYYAPDNAILAIVGDFKAPEARNLVATYFGTIPSHELPKRADLAESSIASSKSEAYRDPLARVPGVVIGYPGPARDSDDFYSLAALDAVLTGGDSSLLQRDLVKGSRSVIEYQGDLGWPFASAVDYKDPAKYAIFALYNPKFKSAQIVDQVQAEIGKIAEKGVTSAELSRARTLLLSNRLNTLQTAFERAKTLAVLENFTGNPEAINTELDHIARVTTDQVKSVAQKYLAADKRTVLSIDVAPPKASGSGAPTTPQGGR